MSCGYTCQAIVLVLTFDVVVTSVSPSFGILQLMIASLLGVSGSFNLLFGGMSVSFSLCESVSFGSLPGGEPISFSSSSLLL